MLQQIERLYKNRPSQSQSLSATEGEKCGLFSSEKPQEPRTASNPTRSPYGEVTSEDRPRGPRRFRTVSVLKAPRAHCGWFCLKSFINCNINLSFLFVCLFEGKKCGLFSSKKPKEPRMALNLTRSLYGEVTSEDRPRGPCRFCTVSVLKAPRAHCGSFCRKLFINCDFKFSFLFVCLFV